MKRSAAMKGSTRPGMFCSQTRGNESFSGNSLRKAVKDRVPEVTDSFPVATCYHLTQLMRWCE